MQGQAEHKATLMRLMSTTPKGTKSVSNLTNLNSKKYRVISMTPGNSYRQKCLTKFGSMKKELRPEWLRRVENHEFRLNHPS
jgi:hypothetical protein